MGRGCVSRSRPMLRLSCLFPLLDLDPQRPPHADALSSLLPSKSFGPEVDMQDWTSPPPPPDLFISQALISL